MADRADPAMQAYHARKEEREQQVEAAEARRREAEVKRFLDIQAWGSVCQVGTASSLILNTVIPGVRDYTARQGSPVQYRYPPIPPHQFSVMFELHRDGQLAKIAFLQFEMNGDGSVVVTSDVSGFDWPPPRSVLEVDARWVTEVALSVWRAALKVLD